MRAEKDATEVPGATAGGRVVPWAGREQLMIETLEEGLTQLYRDRVRVRAIRDKELGKSSSFAIYRIDAQLESGVVLPTIFKNLNPLQQQHGAQDLRGLELERSRREIWAYSHVLPRLALGTPDLYGFRWEPRRGNLWLFCALAVVDWETLATGPQYVDLVSISAGSWTLIERMVMRRAYFEARRSAAGRSPVHSPAPEDAAWKHFNDEVDIVAVLQAVAWLGFWLSSDVKDRKYASRVSRWLSEVRLAMERDVMA